MKLIVIGSSSMGNCYLLRNEDEILVIEAGVKFKKVKQVIDFQVSKIVGLLVSHSHADHAGYAKEFAREGIKVFTTDETISQHLAPSPAGAVLQTVPQQIFKSSNPAGAVLQTVPTASAKSQITNHKSSDHPIANSQPLTALSSFRLGGFHILPFNLAHDVPCFGFLINHPECGNTLFITDTHYSPYTFNNLTNIIIEANYSEQIINERFLDGQINATYFERVLRSHLSFENTLRFLKSNDLSQVRNIILIHLSDGNSDEHTFKTTVQSQLGIPTHIAKPGLTIDFFQPAGVG